MAVNTPYVNPGSTAVKGTYAAPNSGGYQISGAPSYIRTNIDTSGTRNAAEAAARAGVTPANVKTYDARYSYTPTTTGRSSGGGNNGGGGGSSSGGSGGDYSYSGGSSDDILSQIKSLLAEQQAASKRYYETMYNQRMNEINQESTKNRNLINANYKRGERYLNNLYGNTDSGTNWTNRARNNQNWISQLAANRENTASLKDSAAASRDLGLANAASTMAQGWYNYVLPVYTNRQQTLDDYAYRRYLANL